ncbi:unnamed protein product, partial [Amoebophrya sp. A25]
AVVLTPAATVEEKAKTNKLVPHEKSPQCNREKRLEQTDKITVELTGTVKSESETIKGPEGKTEKTSDLDFRASPFIDEFEDNNDVYVYPTGTVKEKHHANTGASSSQSTNMREVSGILAPPAPRKKASSFQPGPMSYASGTQTVNEQWG